MWHTISYRSLRENCSNNKPHVQVNRARWLDRPSGRRDDCPPPSDVINSLQPQQFVGTQSITGDEVITNGEIGSICSAKVKTGRRYNRSIQQFPTCSQKLILNTVRLWL